MLSDIVHTAPARRRTPINNNPARPTDFWTRHGGGRGETRNPSAPECSLCGCSALQLIYLPARASTNNPIFDGTEAHALPMRRLYLQIEHVSYCRGSQRRAESAVSHSFVCALGTEHTKLKLMAATALDTCLTYSFAHSAHLRHAVCVRGTSFARLGSKATGSPSGSPMSSSSSSSSSAVSRSSAAGGGSVVSGGSVAGGNLVVT